MLCKYVIYEDFINYKKPSLFIGTTSCTMKCNIDCGRKVCHNSALLKTDNLEIKDQDLMVRYMTNPITEAVVFGGLEPLDTLDEILPFIKKFRHDTKDPIIIYTGYNEDECQPQIETLSCFSNVIVKFGRFVPDDEPHFDEILGVKLASSNQYAKKIS